RAMQLIKGFGLVILAVVAIAVVTVLIAITPKTTAAVSVKALPQATVKGYLMPVREAAVTVDYSKFTIRELKAMARGTGIKSWEKLRKADLIAALSAI
ncbi:MAG: Rho termination factor N-terminal domain-containing protein, partial [Flammeovirgaceae bacterium]